MTTALITGSTDGIGAATAALLRERGMRVITHGRPDRGADVAADFTDLGQVRAMAMELADEPLDLLINNAGAFFPEQQQTADGHEATWQVNHLAGALLTDLLLDPIAERNGRVIFVSAALHAQATIDLADPDFHHRRYDAMAAYGQSKLASALLTQELARRLPGTPAVVAVHPGVVSTKMLAAIGAKGKDSPQQAAENVLAGLDAPTGSFLSAGRIGKFGGAATDEALAADLYRITQEAIGLPGLGAA